MTLKVVSYILTVITLQAALSSCFFLPDLAEFHKLLSKSQLMKYFDVQNYEDVPEYKLVNIGLKTLDPFYWADNFMKIFSGNTKQPQELFFTAESIFGHHVQMELRKNNRLRAPSFRVLLVGDNEVETKLMDTVPVCHYIGTNGSIIGAFSSCQNTKGLTGILLLPDQSVQILPVDQELASLLGLVDNQLTRFLLNNVVELLHLVFKPKDKSSVPEKRWDDEVTLPSIPRSEPKMAADKNKKSPDSNNLNSTSSNQKNENKPNDSSRRKRSARQWGANLFSPNAPRQYIDSDNHNSVYDRKKRENERTVSSEKVLNLELAVFLDQTGYDRLMSYLKTQKNLIELLLGFVNQVQALYEQPSLSKKIQFSIVLLELLVEQPIELHHTEESILLKAFCKYQARQNPFSDNDPNHWDLALYLSGADLYRWENGQKESSPLGRAYVGGVCSQNIACAIAEFGTVGDDGTPHLSAGFFSTYIAAHEIGHSLGIFHDGPPDNNCPTGGYVMGSRRLTSGYMKWSNCSLNVLENLNKVCLYDVPQGTLSKDLDHSKYNEKPGQGWNAHQQCKFALKDDYATLKDSADLSGVCDDVMCKSSIYESVSAGPALEGTYCAWQKWCQKGQCVARGSEKVKEQRPIWTIFNFL